ncbi:hypothetical protein DIC66_11450 [Rhodoferax lacus]|uniref:Uncharacterized protein n=2 Tax=Rhodoferax lacus TaxID=2184758 RepID=A0A3E1RB96_9BURK|nr:hypothetical protein DIC66_11450 [Rhodoferax lacus]
MKWHAWLLLLVCCMLSWGALAKDQALCKSSKKSAHKADAACVHKAKKAHAAKGASASTSKSASRSVSKGSSKKTTQKVVQTVTPQVQEADTDTQVTLLPGAKPRLHPDSACFKALGDSRASRHLSAKVPFFLDHAPDEGLLANKGHPGKSEKTELASVVAGYEMCLDMAAAWRRETYPPEVVAVLDAYWSRTKSLLGDLQNGRANYGEAARAVALNDSAYKAKVDSLVADLQSRQSSVDAQNAPTGSRLQ